MKLLGLFVAGAIVAAQEPATWRIVVEHRGAFASYREDGKDRRDEPDYRLPKPGLSPDGSRRVYLVDDADRDEIWVSRADGSEPKKLTDRGEVMWLPQWSPDGRRLVYASIREGSWQIWRIDADGGNLTRLTNHPDGARDPRISPRGDGVAYFEMLPKEGKLPPVNLRLVPLEGGDSKRLLERTEMLGFAWSPTGDRLACSLVGELRILDVTTLKSVRAFSGRSIERGLDSHAAFGMHWRPDGEMLAFRYTFLGGRTFGVRMFGDNEVFLLPMKGSPVVIEAGRPEAPVKWVR